MQNFSEQALLLGYPFCSKNRTLIDVGAHNGNFGWPFARRGWRVIAFEPEKENFKLLKRKYRGLKGIACINKAISNEQGSVPFYVSTDFHGIHSLRPFHPTHKLLYNVEAVRLDEILNRLKIDSVTLLKIDVEGADYLALQSFDFQKYRPEIVMVEFMDQRSIKQFGYSHHDMVQYMKKMGFYTFVSEWGSFEEYARKGQKISSHRWIKCQTYPLEDEPHWGNLIFVPEGNIEAFKSRLEIYLHPKEFKTANILARARSSASKIPGSRLLFNLWLSLQRHQF